MKTFEEWWKEQTLFCDEDKMIIAGTIWHIVEELMLNRIDEIVRCGFVSDHEWVGESGEFFCVNCGVDMPSLPSKEMEFIHGPFSEK